MKQKAKQEKISTEPNRIYLPSPSLVQPHQKWAHCIQWGIYNISSSPPYDSCANMSLLRPVPAM